ncbi:MAG: hypothetical protein AB8H80_09280 [Planctomycetota bacterium]
MSNCFPRTYIEPLRSIALLAATTIVSGFTATDSLSAQCPIEQVPAGISFGVLGAATNFGRWDPDGSGPQTEKIVIGGTFSQAGSLVTAHLAFLDPVTGDFTGPVEQPNGGVNRTIVTASGDLIVVGSFTRVGATSARGIARFDGASWSPLGGGADGNVSDVLEAPNGDLFVSGTFGSVGDSSLPAGPIPAGAVARWDGTNWDNLGGGVAGGNGVTIVSRLALLANGDLAVAGSFTTAGGVAIAGAALYDGISWGPLGSSQPASLFVSAMELLANGDLILAVNTFPGGSGVLRVRNGAWVATPASGPVRPQSVLELPNGNVLVSDRSWTFGPGGIYELDGNGWSLLTLTEGTVSAMAALGTTAADLLVGGSMVEVGGTAVRGLAARIGGTWVGESLPRAERVFAMATAPDGTQYAGGSFTQIEGTAADNIARWDGSSWHAMSSGLNGSVESIAIAGNGDVYATGAFTLAGGVPTLRIARWDGSAWHAVAGASNLGTVRPMRNGNLLYFAAGNLSILANGVIGAPLPSTNIIVDALEMPDGRIAATGWTSQWGVGITSRTAIWDGTSWAPTTYDHTVADGLALAPNGDLVVIAPHSNGQRIRSWDGTNFQDMGSNAPISPARGITLPNGDLAVACEGNIESAVQRFDGTSWSAVGNTISRASSITFSPSGELAVALQASESRILRLRTACPATLQSEPSACSVGGAELAAAVRPFVGATYRATASALESSALAVHAFGGQSSNTLLNALLPTGAAGCVLRVSPEILELRVATGSGTSRIELAVPSGAPALVGLSLRHQAIGVEFGSNGSLGTIVASNALAMTIGSF